MRKRKHLSRLLGTVLISAVPFITGHAQSREAFSFNSTINPSTETFEIAKYGKLTPSLYTGAMSFSIPVFTYEDPDFTIPISLDYNFNGYKPSVHSGTVGYGWFLNCGGNITREVIGLPDDAQACETMGGGFARAIQSGIFNTETDITNSKQIYLEEHIGDVHELSNVNIFSDCPNYNWKHVRGAGYDTCPDIFHFSFLGYSGEFMLTKDGSVKIFNTSHPYGEFTVEYDFSSAEPSSNSFSEIRIKTGNGYCYYFGGSQKNVEFSKSSGSMAYTISGWKLRKVTAPNGNTVEFIYDILQRDYSIFECYTPDFQSFAGGLTGVIGDQASSQTMEYTQTVFHYLLSKIRVNDDVLVNFVYDDKSTRENEENDFNGELLPSRHEIYEELFDEKRLASIHITNINSQTVEKVDLTHTFTSDSSGAARMFMTKLTSKQFGSHSFEYDGVSSQTNFPKNDTYATDYWGYWNGQSTAFSLKSYIMNPVSDSMCRDLYEQLNNSEIKSSDFSYSKMGGLTKITYPTGGSSRIEYEPHNVSQITDGPNSYKTNSIGIVPGGIRVAKIIHESDDITDCIRYIYSGGTLIYMPRYAVRLDYIYRCRISDPYEPDITARVEAEVSAVGYTDDCSMIPLRDPHVTYSNVTNIYEDESSCVYEFYDSNEWGDKKEIIDTISMQYTGINIHRKDSYFDYQDKVYHYNGFDYDAAVKSLFLPNIDDFSRFRGKTKAVHEYDSDGRLIKSVTYNYGNKTNSLVHSQTMVYNTLLDFTEAPLRIYAPILEFETHTTVYDNGQSVDSLSYTYNASGQRTGVSRCVDGKPVESQSIRYYPESHPNYEGDTLKTAVSDIVNLKITDEGESLTAGIIKYHYDDTSNPQPSSIEYFSSESPAISSIDQFVVPEGYVSQTVTYSYHPESKRLIHEEFPGNRYFCYAWDRTGRNILSRMSNSEDNITKYSWFDMVGLYDITYPTESKTEWGYDNHNRISDQYDTNGTTQKRYEYHLLNP